MATTFVDRAYLLIDSDEFECKSISLSAEMDGHDTVKTMNRANRSKGHKSGVPNFECSVELPLPEDGHDIDFFEYMLNRTEFETVIEYQDGSSRSIDSCQIKKVDEDSASGDEVTVKLEIAGLDIGID